MPSLADVFLRLRVDQGQVRRDIEAGANRVDTRGTGERAGRHFGDSFARSAASAISIKGVLIGSAIAAALAVGPAGIALGVAGAGVAIGAALTAGIIKSIKKEQKTLQAEILKLSKVKNPTADQKAQLAADQQQLAIVNKQAQAYNAVAAAASTLKQTLLSTFTVALQKSGILTAFTKSLLQFGTWVQQHRDLFTRFFAAAAPYVPILARFFERLVGTLLPEFTRLMQVSRPAVEKVLNAFIGFVKTGVGGFLQQVGKGAFASAGAFARLLGALSPLLPAVARLATLAAILLARFPLLLPALLGLAVASKLIGPILGLAKAFEVVKGAMIALKITSASIPWIALATAAILVTILVIKHWGPISAFFAKIWRDVYGGFVKPLIDFFTNSVPHAFDVTIAWLKQHWPLIVAIIGGPVGAAVVGVMTHWNDLKRGTHDVWESIKDKVLGAANWVKDKVLGAFRTLRDKAKDVWNAIGGFMSAGIRGGEHALADAINFVTQRLINPIVKGYNTVNNIWSGADISPIPPVKFAAGGKISKGTHDTADDVLIRVSKNETVLSAAHSRILAPALSALGVPGYADGGRILADAVRYKGHPYRWGGPSNPGQGWDCSSFVGYVLGHDFGLPLPGGARWNPHVHGPVASQYNHEPGFRLVSHNVNDIRAGDLLVENSGGHVGFGVGPNRMFSAFGAAFGTIFTDAANMTNIYRSGKGGGIWPGGGLISPKQQKAYDSYLHLLNTDIGLYSPQAILHQISNSPIPKGVLSPKGLAALTPRRQYSPYAGLTALHVKPTVLAKYKAAVTAATNLGAPGGNPLPGVGKGGTDMQNGTLLYNYLLTHLFGGNRIASAGAIASIWGESLWNPFAVGTGGRGLIGWTPPSTISDAVFQGGMATQLPAILDFVVNSGDQGVIARMFQATSVLDAANLWGRGVERFGINDVHSQGIALAKRIAGLAGGGHVGTAVRAFSKGGRIPEPVVGIGRSGGLYSFAEAGDEWAVNGDMMRQLVAELRALRSEMRDNAPRTAAGVAQALKAPKGQEAQAARMGAR